MNKYCEPEKEVQIFLSEPTDWSWSEEQRDVVTQA